MNSLQKEYFKNVIPSVLSFTLGAIYCFCDAFFVGNRIGDLGLAAINISFSFLSLFIAVGAGIGMGASVKYSILKARNMGDEASNFIYVAYVLMLYCSIVLIIPCFLFPQFFLRILGASEVVADLGKNYFRICSLGALAQIFSCGLPPICRNNDGAIASMNSFILGCVVNIFLDWLFIWVFEWGMEGAAEATVIGQFVSFFICLRFLFKKKIFSFRYKKGSFLSTSKQICKVGISPFGLTIVPNISVVVLNKASLYYGNDIGLAAYGCMAYLVYIVYMVMQGVTDGSQPLISTYFGKHDFTTLKKVKKYTYVTTMAVAVLSFILEVALKTKLGPFMGSSGETASIIEHGIPVFAFGFFFVAFSRSTASCLYACENNIRSYLISYTEPVFILLSILLIGQFTGLNGVWISNTVGQGLVMVLASVLLLI